MSGRNYRHTSRMASRVRSGLKRYLTMSGSTCTPAIVPEHAIVLGHAIVSGHAIVPEHVIAKHFLGEECIILAIDSLLAAYQPVDKKEAKSLYLDQALRSTSARLRQKRVARGLELSANHRWSRPEDFF